MTKRLPIEGLQVLCGYFEAMLSHHCSVAGCNDMPRETFFALTPAQKEALLADFEEYDKKSNPDGWEPKTVLNIPDFSWAGYFMKRVLDAISEQQS